MSTKSADSSLGVWDAASSAAPDHAQLQIERRAHAGANWFFWIAGLSMVNSLLVLAKVDLAFTLGLWMTQVLDYWGLDAGGGGRQMALVGDLVILASVLALGAFARQGRGWAFVFGLALYALDGLLLAAMVAVAVTDGGADVSLRGPIISGVAHLFIWFRIYQGYAASRRAGEVARMAQAAVPVVISPPQDPVMPSYIVPGYDTYTASNWRNKSR